jgi:hypothetical protein
MRARKFAQDGEIEIAIGVTSITGRGSGVVDLDWDRGWVFQLGEAGSGKVCLGWKRMWVEKGSRVKMPWAKWKWWWRKKNEVGQQ